MQRETFVWFEVFIETLRFEHVLILRSTQDGKLQLYDPSLERTLSTQFTGYDDATTWLTDEEYSLVDGRWMMDD